MASIKLDGNTLSTTEIALISMGEKVEVASDAWHKIMDTPHALVDDVIIMTFDGKLELA